MNIRIGNDIQIRFSLRGIEGFEKRNIKQMRVYLINESSTNVISKDTNTKYYCGEAFPQMYTPSEHSLHTCGPSKYNVQPYDKCSYSTFGGDFHDPHYWPYYNGFGVTPDKFTNHKIPVKPGFYQLEGPSYLAPSKLEEGDNRATAYFQACDQLYCGPYKMIVLLVLYDQGWNKNDLHTYTIDYGIVFNLVSDEDGQQGNIVIELDKNVTKVIPSTQTIYMNANSRLELGQIDSKGTVYDINIVYDDGTIKSYKDDKSVTLKFYSSNSDIQITEDGTIISPDSQDGIESIISIFNEDGFITSTFHVYVNFLKQESIGFAASTDIQQIDLDGVDDQGRKLFKQVDNLEGNIQVTNYNYGYYLWIVSRTPIQSATSSNFEIPLNDPVKKDGLYYYVCPTAQIATTWVINIEK